MRKKYQNYRRGKGGAGKGRGGEGRGGCLTPQLKFDKSSPGAECKKMLEKKIALAIARLRAHPQLK